MRIFILLLTLLVTQPSWADWQIINDRSQFNIVSTKKVNATEVHQFTQLKGDILPQGEVKLIIDLSSIETNIPIRNVRMKNFLFETKTFPQATFTTSIDSKVLDKLSEGQVKNIDVIGDVSLHGAKQSIKTQVQVVKLTANTLLVNSLKPIVIQASDFDLDAGIEKLKTLAALPSISYAVPITFSLYFAKDSLIKDL